MLVSHKAIAGYMPAMAMPFRAREPRELEGLKPGSRVDFQLVVSKRESYARRIRAQVTPSVIKDAGDTIRIETPAEKVAVGGLMPDFSLTDQSSRPVRLSEFQGRVVALNFIYTRCPLPDVCPRLSAGFAKLQRRFRSSIGSDLTLVSITLDPTYDTPEVLARYAGIWRADPDGWRFLTGSVQDIQRTVARFGLVYWPEEGLITHTSSTAVIGRDGRLAAMVEGTSYETDQLGDLIAHLLGRKDAIR